MIFIKRFINKFRISIFKVNRYNELIKEKLSSAIIYSLLLSIILGAFVGVYEAYVINDVKNKVIKVLENDKNKFTLENGILNFENSPTKYEKGKFIIYIDTNKGKNEIDLLRSILIHKDYSMAILKDGVVIDVDGIRQEYTFINDEYIIKNQDFIDVINQFGFLGNFIIIIIIIKIFIGMLIDALLLSIIAQVINKLENLRISYKDTFKICIHAITFSTIISQMIYLNSLGFLISGFYLILAIKSIKNYKI